MLIPYVLQKDKLQPVSEQQFSELADQVLWVDLINPSEHEEALVEMLLGIEIPTRDEMHEIELSSRLYQKDGILYTTATVMTKAETPEPECHAISFVLSRKCVVTVRYCEPMAFKVFAEWGLRGGCAPSCQSNAILSGLMEAIVDRMADVLESIGHEIDDISRKIFRPNITDKNKRAETKPNFEEMLRQIAIAGDHVSKARESLVSITRLLGFVSSTVYFKPNSDEVQPIQTMLRDIPALNDHASFLSNKVNFLLDATLGMVGIEQNSIIKFFSVAAVVFLPPTLVASIYGMNFQHMPELDWKLGYPLAIGLMIMSAVIPYRLFKRKGWL
jgi:magnesium transporter